MKNQDFVLDADSDEELDLSVEDSDVVKPTKDVEHSILEPMKIEPLQLPQSIIDKMKAGYSEVCVNDFQDIYHMPEEERKEAFQFYDVFKELSRVKNKHRKLDSFIMARRTMMKVLNTVAETNGIYEPKEFVKKVLKKKIVVSGLKFPKYVGKNKKDINWKLVGEYILDESLDPKDLLGNSRESYFELVSEDDIKQMENLYGDSVFDEEYIMLTEEEISNLDMDEDLAGENIVVPLSKKNQKALLKDSKEMLTALKDAKKFANNNGNRIMRSFAFELTQDAFDEIREKDESTGNLSVPKFKGNAFRKQDIDVYMAKLEEYDRSTTQVEHNGRYYSVDDFDELTLKSMLESNGFDIRKFYSYKKDEKKLMKAKRKEKKKIERLKKTLRDAKKRYEDRDSDGGVNSKKKKSKKSKKSKKKISNALVSKGYDSIEDYARAMEEWGD